MTPPSAHPSWSRRWLALGLALALPILTAACDGRGGPGAGSGQTGSLGPSECDEDAPCAEGAQAAVDALLAPAAPPPALTGVRCEDMHVILDTRQASGPACICEHGDAVADRLGPVGLGCHVRSRGGECLVEDADVEPCNPGDADGCQAACEAVQAERVADAERSFDAEVRYAACDAGGCRSVVRIDDRCYPQDAFRTGRDYDCALEPEAMLELYFDELSAPPGELLPDVSPYVEGTDGFLDLTVSRRFYGDFPYGDGFGVMAQFFTIEGESGTFGEVIDPLEGLDDCGVSRRGGLGVGANMEFVDIDHVTLIDGERRVPIPESFATNPDVGFFTYDADLSGLGVSPRFGGSYGFEGGGGGFGADFAVDGVRLPEDLAFPGFQASGRIDPGPLELDWTGGSSDPLRVRLWLHERSDFSDPPYEIECLLRDDGHYVIDAALLDAAPGHFVHAIFQRERRRVMASGDKHLLTIARVTVEHELLRDEACDGSEAMTACEAMADHIAEVFEACDVPVPPRETFCPDYIAESCNLCPEHFECRAAMYTCDDGLTTSSGSCPCP